MPFINFKKIFLCLLLILVPLKVFAESDINDSVVKVYVTANQMDYYRPWQSKGVSNMRGSGSILKGRKVLTNAHVVADQTFIQLKRNNDPKKYTARLLSIDYDCDLAVLTVDDDKFFEGVKPLELGVLPRLKDTVAVMGYPEGGSKLSITEGVVSRVEVTTYVISARKLLTIQIDAAINPGNSGGPVVMDGKLVGVAMQGLKTSQNIGYMIPVPVIEHSFKDLEDGEINGFPLLGIDYSNTENKVLRKHYKIDKIDGGVLINNILPYSPAEKSLQVEDVILSVNNIDIGEDGTFEFRKNERITLQHLFTMKQVNDEIDIKVMRNGEIKHVKTILTPFAATVPHAKYYKTPEYYIFGGFVFTILSTDLLEAWGEDWWERAPIDFTYYLIGAGRANKVKKKNHVVLLHVLSDEINVGYQQNNNNIVEKVNGQEFSSFQEFVMMVEESKENQEETSIDLERTDKIILENKNIDQITQEIIKRNNISSPYSQQVQQWINDRTLNASSSR